MLNLHWISKASKGHLSRVLYMLAMIAAGGTYLHAGVTLQWDPNAEPDLSGYNLYRSPVSGSGYVKVNPSLIESPSYTDNTIVSGTTYYYVCTAVNSSGLESGFSNEVSYTAPVPVCAGDTNSDSQRNVLDIVRLLNHIVGNLVLTGGNLTAADVNGDGSVNVLDSVRLQNHVVGSASLPACQ